jgi:hypothetical protein
VLGREGGREGVVGSDLMGRIRLLIPHNAASLHRIRRKGQTLPVKRVEVPAKELHAGDDSSVSKTTKRFFLLLPMVFGSAHGVRRSPLPPPPRALKYARTGDQWYQ